MSDSRLRKSKIWISWFLLCVSITTRRRLMKLKQLERADRKRIESSQARQIKSCQSLKLNKFSRRAVPGLLMGKSHLFVGRFWQEREREKEFKPKQQSFNTAQKRSIHFNRSIWNAFLIKPNLLSNQFMCWDIEIRTKWKRSVELFQITLKVWKSGNAQRPGKQSKSTPYENSICGSSDWLFWI